MALLVCDCVLALSFGVLRFVVWRICTWIDFVGCYAGFGFWMFGLLDLVGLCGLVGVGWVCLVCGFVIVCLGWFVGWFRVCGGRMCLSMCVGVGCRVGSLCFCRCLTWVFGCCVLAGWFLGVVVGDSDCVV